MDFCIAYRLKLVCKCSVVLQKYMLLFQSREPLIHKMHHEQLGLLKQFLGCFVKPEAISGKSPKESVKLKVKENMLPVKDIFVGDQVGRGDSGV